MKNIIKALLTLCLSASFSASAFGQMVTVSGTQLTDSSGSPVSNATITFAPSLLNGQPTSFRKGVSGGQTIIRPVTATVTSGAFSLSVADSSTTDPVNVCYNVTVTDNVTGNNLLGSGYGCVQPSTTATWCSGTACNFDSYPPNLLPQAQQQSGPQGIQGIQGIQGPIGAPTSGVNLTPSTSQTVTQPSGTALNVVGALQNNGAQVIASQSAANQQISQTGGTTLGVKARAVIYGDLSANTRKIEIYNDPSVADYSNGSVVGTIQWALNTVGANGGGEVLVYPGIYPISNAIVMDYDWITLEGSVKTHWNKWGGGFPVHSSPGLPGGAQIIVPAGKTGITVGTNTANMHGDVRHKGIAIRNLYLQGQNVASYGVFDTAITDISEISHTTFQGFETAAISIGWDSHQLLFNDIQDNDGGGIIDFGLYPTIEGNIVYDGGGTGIAITGGRQAMIYGNSLGNLPNCVVLTGGSSTVFGNTMNNGCNGVVNTGGTNLIYGNFGDAMPFFDTTSGAFTVSDLLTASGTRGQEFAANLATGGFINHLIGLSDTNFNALYLSFSNIGGPGSALNTATMGLVGTTALTFDNLGDVMFGANATVPAIRATTGTRYVCVDTNGKLVSSATACSGS